MSHEECIQVLDGAEYGVLSTISADGTPYGTPLNFARKDNILYFHSAVEGHKIENIKRNGSVCFNAVDSVVLMPKEFNTQYRSVTVFGDISVVEDADEKREAIKAIADKLSPDFPQEADEYIDRAFSAIVILRLSIEHMTGKATRG